MVNSVPNIKFGLEFCESSGECLIRVEGTDEELKKAAAENMLRLSAPQFVMAAILGLLFLSILLLLTTR